MQVGLLPHAYSAESLDLHEVVVRLRASKSQRYVSYAPWKRSVAKDLSPLIAHALGFPSYSSSHVFDLQVPWSGKWFLLWTNLPSPGLPLRAVAWSCSYGLATAILLHWHSPFAGLPPCHTCRTLSINSTSLVWSNIENLWPLYAMKVPAVRISTGDLPV